MTKMLSAWRRPVVSHHGGQGGKEVRGHYFSYNSANFRTSFSMLSPPLTPPPPIPLPRAEDPDARRAEQDRQNHQRAMAGAYDAAEGETNYQRQRIRQRNGTVNSFRSYHDAPLAHIDVHSIGPCDIVCSRCQARHWAGERTGNAGDDDGSFSLCCQKGQVVLPPIPAPPAPLDDLLYSAAFRTNIRRYNSLFEMASSTANISLLPPGVSQFRVNGAIHHRMGGLQRPIGAAPGFAQLYILDPDDALDQRMRIVSGRRLGLNRAVVQGLQEMLMAHNPYARSFLTAKERLDEVQAAADAAVVADATHAANPNPTTLAAAVDARAAANAADAAIVDVQLHINTDGVADIRRYNRPTGMGEVAAFVPEDGQVGLCWAGREEGQGGPVYCLLTYWLLLYLGQCSHFHCPSAPPSPYICRSR